MPQLDDKQARLALERLRRLIAVVLGSLALLAVVVTVAGLWPTESVDEFARAWLGRPTLRARLVGVFCVYGLLLLAALLLAWPVVRLLRRRNR